MFDDVKGARAFATPAFLDAWFPISTLRRFLLLIALFSVVHSGREMSAGAAELSSGVEGAEVLLQADFNNKTVDEAIGEGGPSVGEPVDVSPAVTAIVRDSPFPTPCLEITDDSSGSAGAVRFEFPDSREITEGIVTICIDFWFTDAATFSFSLREQGSSTSQYISMRFIDRGEDGEIRYDDEDGYSDEFSIGRYPKGRSTTLKLRYDMDAGTYDVWLDDEQLLDDEPHGVTDDGLGAILITDSNLSATGASVRIDNLSVSLEPPANAARDWMLY